jgi:hypothetical protein
MAMICTAASKSKMADGVSLSDDDRWPWLALQIGESLRSGTAEGCCVLRTERAYPAIPFRPHRPEAPVFVCGWMEEDDRRATRNAVSLITWRRRFLDPQVRLLEPLDRRDGNAAFGFWPRCPFTESLELRDGT